MATGDTLQVRECAEEFRNGGKEFDLPRLVELADELESSVDECNLGASLRCLDLIREVVGFDHFVGVGRPV